MMVKFEFELDELEAVNLIGFLNNEEYRIRDLERTNPDEDLKKIDFYRKRIAYIDVIKQKILDGKSC